MIEMKGQFFRAGVGAVIVSPDGSQVLVFEREKIPGAWQFPQGGLEADEEPELAVYREIEEETGLTRAQVRLLAALPEPLAYELPSEARSKKTGRGQVQYWFYFELTAPDSSIQLPADGEFVAWRWADFDQVVAAAVEFRRGVYARLRQHFRERAARP